MKKKAHELEFISQINRDGSGTTEVKGEYLKFLLENPVAKDDYYELHQLSLTEQTYIAFNLNVFVVKLKKRQKTLKA
jgi:hypothetical protein